ncbi:alcohol dehydrogenase catalytic domain-containing protein [Variovorax rhizosphaerae]|uniref:Alcohol dehydrogenase catalytic domain-containing protein n=1 Tax=Variovorax rhizosphaerae TaxID=1836200 RepID=A0ABU8WTD4_9BURK
MKALVLEGIQKLSIQDVPEPTLTPGGAIIRVIANGVCRSDWHVWMGDMPRAYPIVIGHEMAGVVEEVSEGVTRFKKGDRVVVPFVGSDGTCEYCQSGRAHLCDNTMIPGRNYSGGYGEYVCVPLADRNMVPLPEEVSFRDGAALGCRFMTSFHGVIDRAAVTAGEWVVVYGCGGVGLSAINVAAALGARVIGVDLNSANLELAKVMGAEFVINGRETENPVGAVMDITKGGAHVSIDALGISETCVNGIRSLRKGGRHLQIGLTIKKEAGHISVPIDLMIYRELQIIGTLGMAPHRYASMIPLVANGRLTPGKLVTREIGLSEVGEAFESMTRSEVTGTFVVTDFHR